MRLVLSHELCSEPADEHERGRDGGEGTGSREGADTAPSGGPISDTQTLPWL